MDTRNAIDPLDLRQARARGRKDEDEAVRKRAAFLGSLRRVMESKDGEAVLLHILRSAHVLEISYTNSSDTTAFREGERNVGLGLMANMNKADEALFNAYVGKLFGGKQA